MTYGTPTKTIVPVHNYIWLMALMFNQRDMPITISSLVRRSGYTFACVNKFKSDFCNHKMIDAHKTGRCIILTLTPEGVWFAKLCNELLLCLDPREIAKRKSMPTEAVKSKLPNKKIKKK